MLAAVLRCSLGLVLIAALGTACHPEREREDAPPSAASGSAAAQAEPPAPVQPVADRPYTDERPLPAFSGWTLGGEPLSMSSLLGRRLLLFFFNPEVANAAVVAREVVALAPLSGKQNFRIVGVAVGSSRSRAEAFVREQGIPFEVIDDSAAQISPRLGLRSPLALLGVDAEGYLKFGLGEVPPDAELVRAWLRKSLRLPDASGGETLTSQKPEAPDFEAEVLDGGARFSLSAQRGRPVVLIFFLHTCPHCHDALGFLKQELAALPEDTRPLLVGVEVSGRTLSVRDELRQRELDFFPVLFDPEAKIRGAYGVFGSVPDTFLIDAEGRIAGHVQGWRSEEDPPLTRMRLARLAGTPVPMLLRSKGYSGSEVCGVCHETQYDTWLFTSHASAFGTLVKHGADANGECVSCHVVGWGEPGGFSLAKPAPFLEGVGCESCHGRGGPHLSPGFAEGGNYEPACAACHDAKHSLGFEYASFVPRISHAANLHLTRLPPEERRKRLAERGRPGGALLPTQASYVGSEGCESCHPAEFATWRAGAHAQAVETLAARGKARSADCLACHTTGFGLPGGFPSTGDAAAHPDLARVGCESCHGPGGNHVAGDAAKVGSIVSLGDKCDSCVILQICGTCHDDVNDPGFEFEVVKKIESQRHGTIEAGTGKPKTKASPQAAGKRSAQRAEGERSSSRPAGRAQRASEANSRAAGERSSSDPAQSGPQASEVRRLLDHAFALLDGRA